MLGSPFRRWAVRVGQLGACSLAAGCAPMEAPFTDCADVGTGFDPIMYMDGDFNIPDPYSHNLHPYHGIGGAFKDFGPEYQDDLAVSITWCGQFPLEGGPLLHVTVGTSSMGIGAWPAHDLAEQGVVDGVLNPVMFLGVIGDPPTLFSVLNSAPFTHTNGIPRQIEIRSQNGFASVYLDGVALVPPTAIPAELVGSSKHGIAIDTHFATTGFRDQIEPSIQPAPDPSSIVVSNLNVRRLE